MTDGGTEALSESYYGRPPCHQQTVLSKSGSNALASPGRLIKTGVPGPQLALANHLCVFAGSRKRF